MKAELFVVPDCPHHHRAATLLRQALDDVGRRGQTVDVTVITTGQEAARRDFPGSPTILINGIDPFAAPGRQPAVACRIYPGGQGVPDADSLRQALERAADTGPPRTGRSQAFL